MKYLTKAEIGEGVLHIRDQTPPGTHMRVSHIFERQGDAGFTVSRRRDPMPQGVAVEYHESAGRDLYRSGHDRRALLTRMQFIVQSEARVIDYAQQQRVAAACEVRRVVVPANVIAGARIEIQRVRMW